MLRFLIGSLAFLFSLGSVMGLIAAAGVGVYISQLTRDLPSVEVLRNYEPPVMTRVHAADGSLVAEFSRERRLFLPYQRIPTPASATPSESEISGSKRSQGSTPICG